MPVRATASVSRPISIASATRPRSSTRMTASAASDEIVLPVAPSATPTSAAASAGASFRPSPTMTTTSPPRRSLPTTSALSSGVASRMHVGDAGRPRDLGRRPTTRRPSAAPGARPSLCTRSTTAAASARSGSEHRITPGGPPVDRHPDLGHAGRWRVARDPRRRTRPGRRARAGRRRGPRPRRRRSRGNRSPAAARDRAHRPRHGSPRPADAPIAARRRPRSPAARRGLGNRGTARSSASRSCRRRRPLPLRAARAACRP